MARGHVPARLKRLNVYRARCGLTEVAPAVKQTEVSREIIGRYERNDAIPSIDIAKRMADAFEVSLDYLVGNANEKLDKATLSRVLEINKLQPKDKEMVFSFLDAFLTRNKLKGLI